MNSFRTLSTICLLISGALVPQVARAQTHQVAGVVEDLDGKPLSHVTIRITNATGTATTDSGEFVFNLSSEIVAGQPIELSVEGGWIIWSPWEGRTFAPRSGTDPIHVRVARRGDPRVLAVPDIVKKIVEGVTSGLESHIDSDGGAPGAAIARDDYLVSKAKDLGLTVEDIKSAIDTWLTQAQGPYQKGLAALYEKHFGEASKLLKQSIVSSEQDLFLKYLALFSAESSQSRYSDAESAIRKALALQPENSAVLAQLGWLLAKEDRFDEARTSLEVSLKINENAFGKESPEVARSLSTLGAVDGMDGHFPAARSAFESALAILGKNHQGADLIAGICLNNLAEVLRNLGKLSEAEGDAQRSLSIERKVGASSLDLTLPLITLGLIYNDLGMYPKSLASLKDAQAIDEKELEPLDVAIVRDLMNLATVYMGENDLISAQHLLEEALSIVQKSGRVDSLEAAGVLYNLGRVYDDEGEYSKARPDLERALAISQEKLGPVNYRVATVLSGLGRLSIDEKNFPEAEKLLREALKINEEVLGPTHLSVGSDHDYLGFLYASEEFYLAAETHYLLAYSIYVNSLGPAHPLVGNVASAIANILRREGRDADAAYYENIGAKAKKPSDGELSLGKPDNR